MSGSPKPSRSRIGLALALAQALAVGACGVAEIDVPATETACEDLQDDDLDGLLDCLDPDCEAFCRRGRVTLAIYAFEYQAHVPDAIEPEEPPVGGAEFCIEGRPEWPCTRTDEAGMAALDVPRNERLTLRMDTLGFPPMNIPVRFDDDTRDPFLFLPVFSTDMLREQYRVLGRTWDPGSATLVVGLQGGSARLRQDDGAPGTALVAAPPPPEPFSIEGGVFALARYPADVDAVTLSLEPACEPFYPWVGWPEGDGRRTVPITPGGVTTYVFGCE